MAETAASRMRSFLRRRPNQDEVQSLYLMHGPALLLYGRSLLGNRHSAEDLLHTLFMKLIEQNALPEDPKLYLFKAMHNSALNLLRTRARQVDLAEVEPWFEAAQKDLPVEADLRKELLELPSDQRQLIVLHIWAGLSFEEIGSVLGVSINTAASRYRYALQKLRKKLEPEDTRNAPK